MRDEIREYNKNKKLIYFKDIEDSFEIWWEYDENNNLISFKNSNGYKEYWKVNNNIHTEITEKEFKQIERKKVIFNNKRINRFELMDI